ncbi:Conserved_hypothetical protein [Hexamita inflata]|uniref:Uncharacterized protein n=1 Tax=Hexamita inflata TaxID=28002 RepID=A0AA86V1J8_9EUKA|nr:Conserved hypothetical protein [Hexamita inflata]
MSAKQLTLEQQADKTYQYIQTQLIERMDAQQKVWDKQDKRHATQIQNFKQKQQARIEMQKKSGQMVTTTQMYLSTQPVPNYKELPELTRRATRNGEFLPHARNCTVSQCHHTMCFIPTNMIKDAIEMNTTALKPYEPPRDHVPINYEKRRHEVLNHFRQLASLNEEPFSEVKHKSRPKTLQSIHDIVGQDPLKAEYLTALLQNQYKPEEIDLLIEQEKRDRIGSQLIEQKMFTTSEHLDLPNYTGKFDDLDKTRSPNKTLDKSKTILKASLAQMLKIGKLTQKIDSEGILDVELAPETTKRKRRNVMFANSKQLHQLGYKDDESDNDKTKDNESEESRGFDSEVNLQKDAGNETAKQIEWFENKHKK